MISARLRLNYTEIGAAFGPALANAKVAPENMHGDMCHGCAERHEGIVH
jgi:hypothetical protein